MNVPYLVIAYTYPMLSFALLLSSSPARSNDALPDFASFHKTHKCSYGEGSDEYQMRENIFKQNLEKILEHNAQQNRRWTAGINFLSDRTDEEYSTLLGWKHIGAKHRAAKHALLEESIDELPENMSWTHLKMAHQLPDQGGCGSCWAMATVTTLSAHSEIAYGKNTHFSAQELVDCVQNPLNCGGKGGCDGATVELAMDWAVYQGVERLDSAPSTYAQGKCKKPLFRSTKEEQGKLDSDGRLMQMAPVRKRTLVESKDELSIGLTGYTSLPTNQYKPLLAALLTGPVAISVDASRWSLYSGGIFDDCKGSYATINHAVVLFGYGKTSRDGYWLIRNSWSDYWGEDGYMRMLRTDDEESTCYTDMDPKMGVSCDGAPSSVKVCGTCGILYDNVVPHFSGGPKKNTYSTDANGRVAPVEDSPMFGNIWR